MLTEKQLKEQYPDAPQALINTYLKVQEMKNNHVLDIVLQKIKKSNTFVKK